MNRQEAIKLIFVMKATYPKHFQNATTEDISNMADAWSFHLSEYTYEQMSMGLKIYTVSDKSGFPPSPGQIIDCYRKSLESPEDEVTAAEAWEFVWKAMCKLSWENPEEEFDKLPKNTQKAIGSASALKQMAMMETDHLMIGEKARFMRQYDAYKERENEYLKLPQAVRDRIENKTVGRIEG